LILTAVTDVLDTFARKMMDIMERGLSMAVIMTAALLGACTPYVPEQSFTESKVRFETKSFIEESERISGGMPQVESFHLVVESADDIIYDGAYGDRPSEITVPQGECRFRLLSGEYSGPAFDTPLWGDEQVLQVTGSEYLTVALTCRQMTCGVRVLFSERFRTVFPGAVVRVNRRDTLSMETESLDYGPSDTGFIHFLPGRLTLDLLENSSAVPEFLTGRECSPSDMFTVTVDVSSSGSSQVEIEVSVDMTASYHEQTYIYGRERGGLSPFDALRPADVALHPDDTLWVAGYVAGCYVNKKFRPGCDSLTVATNIALSETPFPSDSSVTVPVYVYTGPCRSLNLKEHPSILGQRVAVRGVIGTLYDLPAVKKGLEYIYL